MVFFPPQAKLQCLVAGIPEPSLRWFKDGSTPVTPMSFIQVRRVAAAFRHYHRKQDLWQCNKFVKCFVGGECWHEGPPGTKA